MGALGQSTDKPIKYFLFNLEKRQNDNLSWRNLADTLGKGSRASLFISKGVEGIKVPRKADEPWGKDYRQLPVWTSKLDG